MQIINTAGGILIVEINSVNKLKEIKKIIPKESLEI
jgi:hypothetical protein